jgi:hypothetical protein
MAIADRKYASLTLAQARTIDFTQFITTDWDSARWDDTSNACLVKWVGRTPSSISRIRGLTIKTLGEMRTKVRTPGDEYISRGPVPRR